MQATYDKATDTVTFHFRKAEVHESDESKPGVILDYDKDQNLIGMEILDASRRVFEPDSLEFRISR